MWAKNSYVLPSLLSLMQLLGCCCHDAQCPDKPVEKLGVNCTHPRVAEMTACLTSSPGDPAGPCFTVLDNDVQLSGLDRAMLRGCALGKAGRDK
jgi:hypothetical protein